MVAARPIGAPPGAAAGPVTDPRFPMLKRLTLAALLTAATSAAQAQWTSGFGQGTNEAGVRNGSGASLTIDCPSGQANRAPGLFVESARLGRAAADGQVNVVVNGEAYNFTLQGGAFRAANRAASGTLTALVDALRRAGGGSFTVQVAPHGPRETFPLRGARAALTQPNGRSILAECAGAG